MDSFAGKSLEKEWNSPNSTLNLQLILRVLALWRVTSKQRPELCSQEQVQVLYYCFFSWNWKLSFPASKLENCNPTGNSFASSAAVDRTVPKQQSSPFGWKLRLCPEHSLVQLKPLTGSEAVSWLSEGMGFVLWHTPLLLHYMELTFSGWIWFWSCVSYKRLTLPRGSEGRQTALINSKKTVQFIFQLIEKPDWECNYPN